MGHIHTPSLPWLQGSVSATVQAFYSPVGQQLQFAWSCVEVTRRSPSPHRSRERAQSRALSSLPKHGQLLYQRLPAAGWPRQLRQSLPDICTGPRNSSRHQSSDLYLYPKAQFSSGGRETELQPLLTKSVSFSGTSHQSHLQRSLPNWKANFSQTWL